MSTTTQHEKHCTAFNFLTALTGIHVLVLQL